MAVTSLWRWMSHCVLYGMAPKKVVPYLELHRFGPSLPTHISFYDPSQTSVTPSPCFALPYSCCPAWCTQLHCAVPTGCAAVIQSALCLAEVTCLATAQVTLPSSSSSSSSAAAASSVHRGVSLTWHMPGAAFDTRRFDLWLQALASSAERPLSSKQRRYSTCSTHSAYSACSA